jgi:hypothetical protein
LLLLGRAVCLLRRLPVLRLLLRRLPVLLLRGLAVGSLLGRGLSVLLLRRLAILGLLLRGGLPVAGLRLSVARRRLPVLGLLRRARHQLRALKRLLALLRDLTLLRLGERSGLTGILRSTGRVAGGLIHRGLLFRAERNRNEARENLISP